MTSPRRLKNKAQKISQQQLSATVPTLGQKNKYKREVPMKTDFCKVTPLADESTSLQSGNQDLKAFASNSEN